ncbi:MAG: tyrosine-type recombinase/integrase [Christensenellales bacterium]
MVAGHLQEKNGMFYVVLNYRDENGKRKTPWISTNLPVKGNKKRAENFMMDVRRNFVPPNVQRIEEREAMQKGDILFTDFLLKWLRVAKSTVKLTTYASYEMMATRIIIPYFETLNIKLKELTTEDIQEFYSAQLERVSANTVIHYHAVIHRALKYAVKIKTIQSNPAVNVERPRKEKFIGSFYDKKEINTLFDIIQGHPLEVAIKLAAFYGLRREEIIGLKWTAIDFENNTLTIQHTVTECNLDGKHIEVASDTAKTDSSLRTMPLVTNFREMLLAKKEKQEHYRKLCGRSYCKEYLDYIFVNEMGERWKPRYLSDGFKRILEQNGLRRIRFHDLRHTCASLLLANNVPMKKIQEWLGHSDFSTTANIYAHLDFQSKISSAEAMLTGLDMG